MDKLTLLEIIQARVHAHYPDASATEIDCESIKQTGAQVVRSALTKVELESWQIDWRNFYNQVASSREINPFNPVDFIAEIPQNLLDLYKSPSIVDKLTPLLGENIALHGVKLLVKDKFSSDPVFLHQDFAYQYGTSEKYTAFVCLENTKIASGTVRFYLGTHHLGYLSDAGELNADTLGEKWPVLHLDLEPGDMVVMHCQLWHDSQLNTTSNPRVILAATYQNAEDFGAIEVVRGIRSWDVIGSELLESSNSFFKRSRSTRLRTLEAELNILRTNEEPESL